MNLRLMAIMLVTAISLLPACVSSKAEVERPYDPIQGPTYGILDREDEVYPWLAPKYDKGIYASSAETAPFRDNALTTENLRKRIQKTSKKSKK